MAFSQITVKDTVERSTSLTNTRMDREQYNGGDSNTRDTYPVPLFKNNKSLITEEKLETYNTTFVTNAYKCGKQTQIAQQTENPNWLDSIKQYAKKESSTSDLTIAIKKYVEKYATYFNIEYPKYCNDFRNEYFAVIQKYYDNIDNVEFDNYSDMLENGEAYNMGKLSKYCSNNIDNDSGGSYLTFINDEKSIKYALTFNNTGSFRRNLQISNVKLNIIQTVHSH